MNSAHSTLQKHKNLIGTLVATAILVIGICFFYLGKSTFSCNDTLASGPGDQTGLVWLGSVGTGPFWGSTTISNAPFGEVLNSPVHITSAIVYTLFWLVSLIVGPVCSYNLLTAGGLLLSGLTVFWFVRWLCKRNDVAIFASFAATLTPYLQIKTGVHPSYAFFGVLVLIIWLMLSLYKQPTIKKGIGLGLVMTSLFYIDPYFILLGGLIFTCAILVFVGAIAYKLCKKDGFKTYVPFLRNVLISGLITLTFGLAPLAIVQKVNSTQINNEVSSARGDIKAEVKIYSARPSEYLPPNYLHPYLSSQNLPLPGTLVRKDHGSNKSEDVLSISIVVLFVSVATVALAVFYSFKYKEFKDNFVLPVLLLSFIGLIALLTSFPPNLSGMIMPSEIITNYTAVWRVFARLGLVVIICLVIIAAVGIASATQHIKKTWRILAIGFLILVVGFEYLTFIPFNDTRSWSYSEVNKFYYWLKQQNDVDTIAEYPLNESGSANDSVAYFRDQFVHGKKLINSFRAGNAHAVLRNGLRDLSDPQTAPALAALGVDIVVVHTQNKVDMPALPGLEKIIWDDSHGEQNGQLFAYKVVAHQDADNLLAVPGVGFEKSVLFNQNYTEAAYVLKKSAEIAIFDLKSGKVASATGNKLLSFRLAASADGADFSLAQENQIIWQGLAQTSPTQVEVLVDINKPISLNYLGKEQPSIIIDNIDLK